jgi:hypothetical protein
MPDPDPWLAAVAAHDRRVDQFEPRAFDVVLAAMEKFLDLARAAVLDHRPAILAADVPPEEIPPDMNAFPVEPTWYELLAAGLVDVLTTAWGEAFAAVARIAPVAAHPYRLRFIEVVTDRLSRNLWPDGVFEECRYEIQESLDNGEGIDQLRDRLGLVLNIDAPSRQIRGEINRLKREGKRVPGHLYRDLREADRTWHYYARRIARTETMTALNGGSYSAGLATQELLGEQRWKVWFGTTDTRIRDVHWLAHGQVQPYGEKFLVGGEHLDHPGDPLGSGWNVIQCRCTLIVLQTQGEADEAAARYAAELPHRTDPEGNPLVPKPAQTAAAAADTTSAPTEGAEPTTAAVSGYWEGPLVALDHLSGDGRMIGTPPTGIRATNHPWLSFQKAAAPGHDGKISVGRVERLFIAPAEDKGAEVPHLWGGGTFDQADPDALDVMRKLGDGYAGTLSVDLDEATVETIWVDESGTKVDEPDEDEFWSWLEGEDIGKTPVDVAPDWRFAGVTLLQDPAFHTGWIKFVDEPNAAANVWTLDTVSAPPAPAVTASAGSGSWSEQVASRALMEPPAAWFADPQLTGPTKLRVTDEGRVYGHIAQWDVPHAAMPDVYAPRDPHGGDYPRFHHHPVRCSDGTIVRTGPLATGGHASTEPQITAASAQAHYDRPEYIAADVVCGEDQYGIWVSGSLRYGVSPFQVMLLDRYDQSGDWRNDELVASCVVSVPGFHVPHDDNVIALAACAGPDRPRLGSSRPRARRNSRGEIVALTAAGIVRPPRAARPSTGLPADAGFQLLRQFQEAQRVDARLEAAHRRVISPRLAAANARVTGQPNQ